MRVEQSISGGQNWFQFCVILDLSAPTPLLLKNVVFGSTTDFFCNNLSDCFKSFKTVVHHAMTIVKQVWHSSEVNLRIIVLKEDVIQRGKSRGVRNVNFAQRHTMFKCLF